MGVVISGHTPCIIILIQLHSQIPSPPHLLGERLEKGIKNTIVLKADEALVATAQEEFDDELPSGELTLFSLACESKHFTTFKCWILCHTKFKVQRSKEMKSVVNVYLQSWGRACHNSVKAVSQPHLHRPS